MILPIRDESDVAAVRLRSLAVAVSAGFAERAASELMTAVSEIARNTLLHGGGGQVEIRTSDDAIVMVFTDRGPGIADVDQAMGDGWTSRGGLGLGLPSAQRLVDELRVEARSGGGLSVTIVKRRG
jgi:serine/threonine-protein kinase RsbT